MRGKSRVGLLEVLAARHQGEGLAPWLHSGKAARAALALAGVGGVTLALMLTLGGGGPVLSGLPGAGPGQAGEHRAAGDDTLASSALEAKALEVRSSALGQAERGMPEGLTLRPEAGGGDDAPAPRVSLLSPADQGPAMRGEVTAAKPALPASVTGTGDVEIRPAASPAPEPPKVKARLIDANSDKPLAGGLNLSLARP